LSCGGRGDLDFDNLQDRFDRHIPDEEFARRRLHLISSTLMLWKTSHPGCSIDGLIR
jgi:hypothetical protein